MRALASVHGRLLSGIGRVIIADPSVTEPGLPLLTVEDFSAEPWASLTFTGMRHGLQLRLEGPMDAVEGALARLHTLAAAPDLPLPGHFLADMALGEASGEIRADGSMVLTIDVQALTIEE